MITNNIDTSTLYNDSTEKNHNTNDNLMNSSPDSVLFIISEMLLYDFNYLELYPYPCF